MNYTSLDTVLDPKYLEEILGSFSKATGLHIEAVNTKGLTVSIPGQGERCQFCQRIRSHSSSEKKCIDSYKRASAEAAKWDEPYFFRCHAGLVIWAVPIVIQGVALGSIICGQVLMWEPDQFFLQELQKNNPEFDFNELAEKVHSLEVISPEQSQAAADLLYVVVNHLVKRDIHSLEVKNAYRIQQEQIHQDLEARKKNPAETGYEAYLKNERRFLRYIRVGDKTRAQNNLKHLLTDLYTKAAGDKDTIRVRIMELASLTSRAAVEGGADAEQVMTMLKQFNDGIEPIDKIEQFFHKIQDIVETFLEGIFALADKKHLSLVKDARNYIMENCHRPLTVKNAADHLFVSPSHLSRLFRQELDCTFNDYLTRVRVEKSVELMKKPELSVEQVAKAVGYKNQSYFAKVFRKYIGVSPLTYKNSLF